MGPASKPKPVPKRATKTVGGVAHRLTWVERQAGYRMRCTCGWVDLKLRRTEYKAVTVGNKHVRAQATSWQVTARPDTPRLAQVAANHRQLAAQVEVRRPGPTVS